MTFKISWIENPNKESHSWFFDFDISPHLINEQFFEKQKYFCPLICEIMDKNKNVLLTSNSILIPKSKCFYPILIEVFFYNQKIFVDMKFFRFKYLNKQEEFEVDTNKYKYHIYLRG